MTSIAMLLNSESSSSPKQKNTSIQFVNSEDNCNSSIGSPKSEGSMRDEENVHVNLRPKSKRKSKVESINNENMELQY